MTTDVHRRDTAELEQRVMRMSEEVALEPERADSATRKYGVTSVSLPARKA